MPRGKGTYRKKVGRPVKKVKRMAAVAPVKTRKVVSTTTTVPRISTTTSVPKPKSLPGQTHDNAIGRAKRRAQRTKDALNF